MNGLGTPLPEEDALMMILRLEMESADREREGAIMSSLRGADLKISTQFAQGLQIKNLEGSIIISKLFQGVDRLHQYRELAACGDFRNDIQRRLIHAELARGRITLGKGETLSDPPQSFQHV
jgi:hypothetical protein